MKETFFPACDYDLALTLDCGQAFRWRFVDGGWEGVVGKHWVRLLQAKGGIEAEVSGEVSDWTWLRHYLQLDVDLRAVLRTFPQDDTSLQEAIDQCRGLRLLRQEPWECLASFILSSTKQIVQIRQIVALVCERFGDPIIHPTTGATVFSFPSVERIAACSEQELRDCKMGFRAPNLLSSARMIAAGEVNLSSVADMPMDDARDELVKLRGVGRKIADCVLLFAYGFPKAFPIDVWILKALRELYFPKRRPTANRLIHFSQTHFGPNAGYAQQYLFHYMRTRGKTKS